MIKLHTFRDQQAQADALAQAVREALSGVLAERERASLVVSGGSSPKLFLQALSTCPLAWSCVDVTLLDDRWVDDQHADSNARLVRHTLLQNQASAGRFLPLVATSLEPEVRLQELNTVIQPNLPDVAVLGMGEDGHIASLFADAPEWEHAITTTQRFVLLQPHSAAHQRISWSLSAVLQMRQLFLLIVGERKLQVLQQAAAQPLNNAISTLVHHLKVTLNVYWCAQ